MPNSLALCKGRGSTRLADRARAGCASLAASPNAAPAGLEKITIRKGRITWKLARSLSLSLSLSLSTHTHTAEYLPIKF